METTLATWFERDRAHVCLSDADGNTIIEWWDSDVADAITDGFLDPADYHGTALAYAKSVGLAPANAE